LGEDELGRLEAVTVLEPLESEAGASLFKEDGKALGAVLRNHVVLTSGEHEDWRVLQLRGIRRFERKHGAEEDSAGEGFGAEEEHRCGDVGAIGVADGDDAAEMLAGALIFDEVGQLVSAADEVILVEDARGEAAEEAGLAVFEHLSARAEQGRTGAEETAEREESVFVAPGAVEEKEGGRGARFEDGLHEVFSFQWCSIW
jgi:hypothetical protein